MKADSAGLCTVRLGDFCEAIFLLNPGAVPPALPEDARLLLMGSEAEWLIFSVNNGKTIITIDKGVKICGIRI